ncbi:hypothetical protein TEA_012027 [Camellia sinensis var. sinensis]|uniref:Nucleolar protein 10 n=1 Tax=Camellia sinensis var. sinensis TaxID=542762 RepID=A0A4S4DV89_CAMSN|nr:hypothetical protein TEA_012027 [Camellia sinensis var. sinensis]
MGFFDTRENIQALIATARNVHAAVERLLGNPAEQLDTMYLQFYINDNGNKVYTTKKESPLGLATESAHPARFSPDDKYSRQRVLLKKRFGLLPTQKPPPKRDWSVTMEAGEVWDKHNGAGVGEGLGWRGEIRWWGKGLVMARGGQVAGISQALAASPVRSIR